LNTGSCGRKPRRVIETLRETLERFNDNPTRSTFFCADTMDQTRALVARVVGAPADSLLLTQNTTQGLQMVLQSFLLEPGDELVTTTHEHGSLKTIVRYLEETRGIVVRRYAVEPLAGSTALCDGLLSLLNKRTKLVACSEIDCLSGWRPDLRTLAEQLRGAGVPLLVDGAHAPGQGAGMADAFPLWTASGHKWLGGPNGTGVLRVAPEYVERIKPVVIGDQFYMQPNQLLRHEFQGTTDVVRWQGLAAACEVVLALGLDSIAERQKQLVAYVRKRLSEFPGATIRTPSVDSEITGMTTVTWEAERVSVPDLRAALWDQHKIWIQPDFCYGQPGHGMRISCHVANTREEYDRLFDAIRTFTI
jgi:isopenicillin-N epimerase